MTERVFEDKPGVPYFYYEDDGAGGYKLMRRLNGVVEPGRLTITDVFTETAFVPDDDPYDVGA